MHYDEQEKNAFELHIVFLKSTLGFSVLSCLIFVIELFKACRWIGENGNGFKGKIHKIVLVSTFFCLFTFNVVKLNENIFLC